jgi:hypothetical protein
MVLQRHDGAQGVSEKEQAEQPVQAVAKARFWTRVISSAFVPQMISSILIPLTIAGVGWYYTQWQQNLNDLKTMIEFMNDPNPEKRKFGVAMYEYLLNNNRVPVEFMFQSVNFANTSSDRELLPLLEAAINRASDKNPDVKEKFDIALRQLPSRLFVHVLDIPQRKCMINLFEQMKDVDKAQINVPSIINAQWSGESHELRYFNETDKPRAEAMAGLFTSIGLNITLKDIAAVWPGAKDIRPNTFELWVGKIALPPQCQQTG